MEAFPYRFLSFLETREQRLLSWGFYDVSFTVDEIESLLKTEGENCLKSQWQALADDGWSMEDFVEEMSRANLLFAIGSSQIRYRTRFAETVRLMSGSIERLIIDIEGETRRSLRVISLVLDFLQFLPVLVRTLGIKGVNSMKMLDRSGLLRRACRSYIPILGPSGFLLVWIMRIHPSLAAGSEA